MEPLELLGVVGLLTLCGVDGTDALVEPGNGELHRAIFKIIL